MTAPSPSPAPTVSVIIPAFNAEGSLELALRSVLTQTHAPAQVIVVNDGSTDGSSAVARAHGARVRYIEQPHAGPGAARNAGLAAATGDYVAFLDADDYWLPAFLERCVSFLETHPAVVAVSTAYRLQTQQGLSHVLPVWLRDREAPSLPMQLDDFFDFWARHDHVRTGTVIIRKRIVDEAGGQRADLWISQDLEYWGYLATFGPWGFIPEALWIGNSQAAASANWIDKYRARRLRCPTVAVWQSRIVPRLTPNQVAAFTRVRGRVAAGFAHHMILAGRDAEAREQIQTHAATLPRTRVTRVLLAGARGGRFGWRLVCHLLRVREHRKARRLAGRRRTAP